MSNLNIHICESVFLRINPPNADKEIPLSPFLITLVVDLLGRKMNAAKPRNTFEDFHIGNEGLKISHLQSVIVHFLFLESREL